MFKQEDMKNKIIDSDKFISLIKPGDKIFLSSGPAIPSLSASVLSESDVITNFDLEIIQLFSVEPFFSEASCDSQNYRLKTFRSGQIPASDVCSGREDFIPANLVEIPYIFATRAVEIDVAIISTSPPDKRGFMSLGVSIDVADIIIRNASIVIAEVNPNMPFTYGDTSIHMNQVDYVIESNTPLLERERKTFDSLNERIGWHVSNLIQDGSTVVMHVGRIFDAIALNLMSKRNLGILTNVISDWAMDLVEAGAISFNRKRELGGQISTSYAYGSRELYEYVDHNQIFGFYPIAKLANPLNISSIPRLISIMNVEKIDITAGSIIFHSGDDLLSGFESKFNFAVGTAFSGSGKVIFVLRSVSKTGESNIVISHDQDHERLRSTLSAARYVVTEYGIAVLFGKSVRQRALSMIEIAHPDHREDLFNTAKELGYLYKDQIYKSIAANYPVKYETVKTFKDGLELRIRPVKASDEDMMRRLFYKFSDESRYYRYFTHVRIMPHKNMQQYLSVDYVKIFSIVAVHQIGNIEKIVAEARYAAYPDGKTYEMAFLADEEYQGKGIATFLANYLIKIAREKGIETLTASVLSQNAKMLRVFEKLTIIPEKSYDGDTIELTFNLSE